MLTKENAVLLVVDVQGKLAQLMHEKEKLFKNLKIMVKGAKILQVPIIWLEQNPDGLGPTIPELAGLLKNQQSISKFGFSCCQNDEFSAALKAVKRKQIVLTGIETHICIYQTARDLLAKGYGVEVVADAVSSRTLANKHIALEKISKAGGIISSTEMVLFELLQVAEGEQFKGILRLVK